MRNTYKEYLMSKKDIWKHNYDNLDMWLFNNKRIPNTQSLDSVEKINAHWYNNQNNKYKNVDDIINNNQCKLWKQLKEKYKTYLLTNDEQWYINLKLLDDMITTSNTIPKKSTEKCLTEWLYAQHKNYKNNNRSMSDKNKKKIWIDFVIKHQNYLINKSNTKLYNIKIK